MKLTAIVLVLYACAWMSAADVAHIKAEKAKLLGSKHHKRGVLSAVPPFKLGHDIPHVTHSVLKPLVVTYPPTAAFTAVKVPLSHPLLPRYPVGVGHRVPHLPHPHYGLKFPHHHTKALVLPKPDQHFHHHHHHVAPTPVVPVVHASPVPIAAPAIAQPQPSPISPPVHFLSHNHLHLRPLVPTASVLPAVPAHVVAPAFSSFAPQFPYILRAGGAVQSSLFANYPRYPFNNYPSPLIPLGASAFSQVVPHQYLVPQGGATDGVVVEPQATVPVEPTPGIVHAHAEVSQHVQPGVHWHPGQSSVHLEPVQPGVHWHPGQSSVHLEPVQPGVHLHPGQPEIHFQSAHPGFHVHPEQPDIHIQSDQPSVHLHSAQPEFHLQPGVHLNGQPGVHVQSAQPEIHVQPDYHLQQGHTDVHLQPVQPDFHYQGGHTDAHLQPQPDYHFQGGQTDVQLQPDYNQPGLGVLQPTQPTVDSNGWSPVPAQPNDIGHGDAHYPPDGHHHFTQEQGPQIYAGNEQGYHDYQNQLQHHIQQQLEQAQYENHLNSQHQPGQEYGVPQGQGGQKEYNFQQPAAEYGPPGGAEGRSGDAEGEGDTQLYHNHIPLGLQPPLDRPLDHFR